MAWAEHRIEEYRRGMPATWLERRMLEHANPVHYPLAVVASIVLFCGLWMHDWLYIGFALLIALAGHVYCWMWQPPGRTIARR